jgi:hypothetical protein
MIKYIIFVVSIMISAISIGDVGLGVSHTGSKFGNIVSSSTWGPTSFNDARFTGMTSGNLGCGASVNHRSQTARGANFCTGDNTWTLVRADISDDVIQMGDAGGVNDFTITDAWLQTYGQVAQGDHADAIQSWVSADFTLTLTRVTFWLTPPAGELEGTGVRNGDLGRINTLHIDHVYIHGGQGIRSYTPDGTPFAGMHVWIDGICLDGSSVEIGAWNGGTITVDHYANVYTGCTISGGNVVVGTPVACSSIIYRVGANPGTVVGCPS